METLGDRRHEALAETLSRYLDRGAQANVAKLIGRVRPEDVAALLDRLGLERGLAVFRALLAEDPDSAGEVLTEIEPARRLALLEQLTPEQVAGLLERIPVDDAVFVLDSLPGSLRDRLLELVDLRDLAAVQNQLAYPESSAGRLMATELFALPETTRVREAIAALQEKREVEMIFYLYVVDRDAHLVGVTSLRQLLLSRPDQALGDIMQRSVIKVQVDTDQEEVARLASRYDLLAVPVVDVQNHLVGIVTVDDIIDVVKEEANEDLLRMAGTSEAELLYEERALAVARLRLPSLLVSLVGLLLAGLLLVSFHRHFAEVAFLLAFVPVVMGLAGSIGDQASTVAVRSLASGKLAGRALGAFLLRQVKVGVLLGVACGVLAGVAALALHRDLLLGGVIGLATGLALVLSALLGAAMPALLARFGLDPAIVSGPLLAAVNDVAALLIYFALAAALLGPVGG
jgi:magnesium transporter